MRTSFIIGIMALLGVAAANGQQIHVSGTITDAKSGEPLLGVSVYDSLHAKGAVSNPFGF